MHELSIVSSVLDQLEELRRQQGGARISKVALRVGELAGLDMDCLRFGFECVVKDTDWEPLALEIEWIARRQRCPQCQHEFAASAVPHLPEEGRYGAPSGEGLSSEASSDPSSTAAQPEPMFTPFALAPFTACPQCGEAVTATIAGEELQIAYVEVEDSAAPDVE